MNLHPERNPFKDEFLNWDQAFIPMENHQMPIK